MRRYLGNNAILGNLFEKVAKKEMESITFNKLYDILYYASVELNEKEQTVILVNREGIFNFIEIYQDSISVDETDEKIVILNKEKVSSFSNLYHIDHEIEEILKKAVDLAFAA